MLGRVLTHLDRLVACDTQNPPRAITADHRVISYCVGVLKSAGCAVAVTDLGDGCVTLLATRGQARTIVNCHLDTVPADPSWTKDPFKLAVDGDHAVGLGACDVKGAAACMLAAIEDSDGAVALLLTTDEEAGQSRCVREFLAQSDLPYDRAIVAEPTGVRAVTKHRGLATYELSFKGVAAHSSVIGADQRNAVHLATLWCADAIGLTRNPPYNDIRLNIGMIQGGTKANVAASSAKVVFGMRPPPGMHPDVPAKSLADLVKDPESCVWKARFAAPGLDENRGIGDLLSEYRLAKGDPVDFWTEAALFGEAGLTTIVLGPGNIKQAHAADEFVPLEDLRRADEAYKRVFSDPLDAADGAGTLAGAKGVR
jgi:acetylornithine deacetylase